MRRPRRVARPADAPPLRVVDVGTGSGAIAVALAVSLRRLGALEAVEILAVDISADALDLARENAVGHAVADRIAFAEADLLPDGSGPFDLVARQPAVRPRPTRGPGPADARPRSSRCSRSMAAPDGLAVIGRLLDRLPDGAGRRTASPCSRSGRTRARPIVALVAARLPGWSCVVETDLAGLPRVARLTAQRVPQPSPAPRAAVGHHLRVPNHRDARAHPAHRARSRSTSTGRSSATTWSSARTRVRRSARPATRGVVVTLVTGRMVSSAMRFARELDLDRADRRLPGRADPRDARSGLRPARPAARPHAAAAPRSPARSSPGRGRTASIRTSTTSSASSSAPTTRSADDYSAFMGATRRAAPRTWSTSIRHPVTKVLAVGEPPLPTELAPAGARALRRPRRRHDQPPAVPRVRRAGRLEGPGRPLAGAPARRPARGDARDRRPVERPRDARRGRPRDGDADAPRRRSWRSPATSRRRSRRRASPG